MNCIGPTARSQVVSPSQRPPSVSGMAATSPTPLSTGPRMGFSVWPLRSIAPFEACPDSTCPMPASRLHERWQAGSERARSFAALR